MLFWIQTVLRFVLAAAMVFAGIMHFVQPATYVAIIPAYLPGALALVYISGFFEILGGIGLLIPKLQKPAAWGLVALLISVFPANLNMAIHQLPMGDVQPSPIALWLRLPLQGLLIAWAYWYTRVEHAPRSKAA